MLPSRFQALPIAALLLLCGSVLAVVGVLAPLDWGNSKP